MATIDLVYFKAGGGHRAAAQALEAVVAAQRRPWTVRLVDLFDVLDPRQRFRRITGMAPEDYYNKRLAHGWTIGLEPELRLLQRLIRVAHPALVRTLAAHWQASAPDLVVSLVPNVNRALAESVQRARPGVPFVTVMTDLADLPPHFWAEPGTAQHLVCGSERAFAQALAAGHAPARLHRTSGMILRPDFYRAPGADDGARAAARRALGLDPQAPTGVVLFGGHGSAAMQRIAKALPATPLVLLCGHNAALAQALRALPGAARRVVVGHTPDVAHYLRLADFFIGKPGPGSVSEALHCGLPVIVTRNAWTMPQERYNTEWLQAQRVGLVLPGFQAIGPAVQRIVGELPAWRARVAQLHNRAVFEVPEILARLLDGGAPSPDCRAAVTAAT